MTFRQYLVFMGMATALAWLGWLVVLFRLNPDEVGWSGIALFFLTLYMGLVGTFATASLSYRVLKLKRPIVSREMRIAFRHAFLLATGGCLLLFLAAKDILSLGVLALIFVVFGGLEFLALWLDQHQRA